MTAHAGAAARPGLQVLDWRVAAREIVAAIFERERQRWIDQLHWDPSRALSEVEQARTTWGLPGLLAFDDGGHASGSIFYLPDGPRFDIGGITAETAAVTGALLDNVIARAGSERIPEVRCFVFESAPNLAHELTTRGFHLERYLYLSGFLRTGERPLASPSSAAETIASPRVRTTGWRPEDVTGVSAVLHAAYDGDSGKIFAPQGTRLEWERYLRNLVEHGACGDLNVDATRLRWHDERVAAAAIVTTVAPGTAHLAQFAVHPSAQGKGAARALLREVWQTAAAQGFERATLLVAEGNDRARALYASFGLRPEAAFVAASLELRTVA